MENSPPEQASTWQFWIDVGGTFTDCIARHPAGGLYRHKTLSSGVIKGSVGGGSTRQRIEDRARQGDPRDFWKGWSLRLIDANGRILATETVEQFDAARGTIHLAHPLESRPQTDQTYELGCDLEAPLVAVRYILQLPLEHPLPEMVIRLGTTRGTNALLTRSGGKTAFVTTAGFADILRIGHQARPKLFDLNIRKPSPLYSAVSEIAERIGSDGSVLQPVCLDQIRSELQRLKDAGIESIAICLLNAYAAADHEQQVEEIASQLGFSDVSASHKVAPLIKLVSRGDTTVVNAYLNVVLRDYVRRLSRVVNNSSSQSLQLMTSAGGLVSAEDFLGKDSILSGPAGGVVGFARAAAAAGFQRAIGFDMGGTSTDVARYDGTFEREYETEKAGVRIVAPMLAIETVAAGGGSICRFDGVKLAVGPASAGARPGPASYGRGGPLTVTDINLVLGKILPEQFPFPLNRSAAEERLDELRREIKQRVGQSYTVVELANGFLQVANANMAQAIRSVSVARGYDPRQYVLVSFGGAAPQHACAVARELGIRQILNHPDAGILSALGVGHADVTRHAVRGIYAPLDTRSLADLGKVFAELAADAADGVLSEGIPAERTQLVHSLDLRYLGTDATLNVPEPSDHDYAGRFTSIHRQRYGYSHPDRAIEIVAARVEAIGRSSMQLRQSSRIASASPSPIGQTDIYFDAVRVQAQCYRRDQLKPGDALAGPAFIIEPMSTTIVDPGWKAEVMTQGELLVTDLDPRVSGWASTDCDPVSLEIFNRHFESIAEQMGMTLQNTSSSVNVKERLDFSCAIFTRDGDLVVNAPHIPVHLGAMSETVRHVLQDHPDLIAGDVVITNDPYRGGSHLPDVTVVTPIFDSSGEELRFLVASRAHHAEIGGITPGSMPPFSESLAEEGVLIRSFKVVQAGRSRLNVLTDLLESAPYPTRDVASNLADVSAQIAANQKGVGDLTELIARYSWPVVEAYMRHIQSAASSKLRAALSRLPDGDYQFHDMLDNGAGIQAQVTIQGDTAVIDFSGSSDVVPDNLNANRAIVTAATMYCLRCLIDEDIPLNQGMLDPIDLIIPTGLLDPPSGELPQDCPAVAGGNVETSQRIVDVLLGAFGLAAASQGTMNNVLLGNESFGYYETICGGAGATPTSPGADAVHSHMTNTRLTDPEVIEQKYPIRVVEFRIREHSGGAGHYPGGDGVVRCLEFTAPLQVSILSQRRRPYAPYGLRGGREGEPGRNTLIRANGRSEELPWRALIAVQPGDRLVIATPGGGGFGATDPQPE